MMHTFCTLFARFVYLDNFTKKVAPTGVIGAGGNGQQVNIIASSYQISMSANLRPPMSSKMLTDPNAPDSK
jgi:hypothetical protein